MIGTWQLVLIFAIVLVLFGAGRIPKIMKDFGIGLREFKKGINNIEDDNKECSDNVNCNKINSNKIKKNNKKTEKNNNKKAQN